METALGEPYPSLDQYLSSIGISGHIDGVEVVSRIKVGSTETVGEILAEATRDDFSPCELLAP